MSSTEVRWNFTWQGLPARVTFGGSGSSDRPEVDGTVTSFTFRPDGETIHSLTGIGVQRSNIAEVVHVSIGAGLHGLLYAGNDVFNPKHGGDANALYRSGGAGVDTLSLRGNYALSFSATTTGIVENLRLARGSSYDLSLADANVEGGARLTIDAARLDAGDAPVIDGVSETDGGFKVVAGASGDEIIGGALRDALYGGGGADRLRFDRSGGSHSDLITDFSRAQGDRTQRPRRVECLSRRKMYR